MVARRRAAPAPAAAAISGRDLPRLLTIGALLLVAVALVYGRALRFDFVAWDDDINVTQNPYLNPATWSSLLFFWKAPYLKLYIPLTYSVWTGAAWLSRWRAGAAAPLNAHLFHALNLLCQEGSVLCVFALLRALLRSPLPWRAPETADLGSSRTDWAAALGAAAFALHPLQVEPVAWVSGLRDMLSGLATAAALWQYVAYTSASGRARAAHYLAATLLFVCAALAKPSAVVLSILAALLDYGYLGRPLSRCAKPLAVWFALTAAFAVLTQFSQDATHIRALMPLWSRPLVAMDSLAFYLWKLVWPSVLLPDYGRPPDLVLAHGWLYYTWLAPAALALAIRLSPERRIHAVCAGLFAAAPLPVLGLVPFIHQDLSTVADRYVYASLLGPALAFAWHLRAATRTADGAAPRRWPWAAAGLVVLVMGVRSRLQAAVWNDTGTLFGHIVAYNPDSGIAHGNLANFLADRGDLKGAEHHYREALRLRPEEGLPLDNLGNLMAREGRFQEAIGYYERALRDGVPDNVVNAHAALGIVLSSQGKNEEAERHFAAALAINPNRERVRNNFGLTLAGERKYDAAVNQFQLALQIRPDFTDARRNLAVTLARLGRVDDARREMRTALGPGADAVAVDGAIGDFLQVHDEFAQALPFYQEVVKRAPTLASARNSLGFTLFKLGRLDEARRQYEEAARLDPHLLQARFNLGGLFVQEGKLGDAVSALAAGADANPGAVELQHDLGVILLRAGRKQEAIERFRQALRLKPDFAPSRAILDQLSRPDARP